jgi:nucleoside triphosphate pyrophosphatase
VILASSSPRRALLLTAAGITFDVVVPEVDESPRVDEPPAEYVLRLSEEKVDIVIGGTEATVVLGADTTVVLDGGSIGKPTDRDHAVGMLMSMAGRTHSVLTGWTAKSSTARRFGVAESLVTFHERTRRELEAYVDRTQPFDKAGAYALQGDDGWLVAAVRGSRSNVMGLPIGEVVPALVELGVARSTPDRG